MREGTTAGLVVTQEHIDAAEAAGACGSGLRDVPVGMFIGELSWKQLSWAAGAMPRAMVRDIERRTSVPLWGLCREGCGDGYGYGYGYGGGEGSGEGDEYGDRDWGEDEDEDEYGYGFVDGDGDGGRFVDEGGYRPGDGSGYGYGSRKRAVPTLEAVECWRAQPWD